MSNTIKRERERERERDKRDVIPQHITKIFNLTEEDIKNINTASFTDLTDKSIEEILDKFYLLYLDNSDKDEFYKLNNHKKFFNIAEQLKPMDYLQTQSLHYQLLRYIILNENIMRQKYELKFLDTFLMAIEEQAISLEYDITPYTFEINQKITPYNFYINDTDDKLLFDKLNDERHKAIFNTNGKTLISNTLVKKFFEEEPDPKKRKTGGTRKRHKNNKKNTNNKKKSINKRKLNNNKNKISKKFNKNKQKKSINKRK